jgi:M61 glycyl aminopeptidase
MLLLACTVLLTGCEKLAFGEVLNARITLVPPWAKLSIEGNYQSGASTWSFLNVRGGLIGLGDRIESFKLMDSGGREIQAQKIAPGEFESLTKASRFSYEVDLTQPKHPEDAAHISWMSKDQGFLMTADLLPQLIDGSGQKVAARLEFVLSDDWNVASVTLSEGNRSYFVTDPDQGIFFVGRGLKETRKRTGSLELLFVHSDGWPFADEQVTKIATRVLQHHTEITGYDLHKRVALMLAALPGPAGADRWSAETRGSTVVLLLGRNAGREGLLGRLSVVLAHELFHLWVPNSLQLSGSYDWFFEGFTLYQALRTSLRLGFIGFPEFLDTLGRVYDSYLNSEERYNLSLIEASERRWTVSSSLVYDKGMLVAFLYDLMLRAATRNNRSLDSVYREIFDQLRLANRRQDANKLLVSILGQWEEANQFARRYIQGASAIDLVSLFARYGLRPERSRGQTILLVCKQLSRQQREVLMALGYNGNRKS